MKSSGPFPFAAHLWGKGPSVQSGVWPPFLAGGDGRLPRGEEFT